MQALPLSVQEAAPPGPRLLSSMDHTDSPGGKGSPTNCDHQPQHHARNAAKPWLVILGDLLAAKGGDANE